MEPTTNGVGQSAKLSVESTPLRIIIVGAGIGGLSAAIFLRQRGHTVTILEQSRFANELGAAVHLAPNSNGLLKRMGIVAEETGANQALVLTQYLPNGKELFSLPVGEMGQMWQHKWLLAHRVHIHAELKRRATMEEGEGRPAELKTRSRVLDVDIEGRVTLESGEIMDADVIVGADGVHSRARTKLPGAEGINPFGSGKSAFRFLFPRSKALADADTKSLVEKDGHVQVIFGKDRRVIIYPTSNNELLNFVCIHPTKESDVQANKPGHWNQQGHLGKMLEVYKDFAPNIIKLLGMADEETLKVWELLDMENLPTWTKGKLVCIGDAAHPFTPHQGQGAGQAIEDAASLAVILPLGTPRNEIPARLKLYEKCRYERASRIQEFSRMVGKDHNDGLPLDANKFTAYNFGHDEWDHSSQMLRQFLLEKNPAVFKRNPVGFGPMPGPRQNVLGNAHDGDRSRFKTASIKFRTSRTVLQNLFPTKQFRFSSPATNVFATYSVTTLSDLEWLGGKGYSHFGLYIHGVEYEGKTRELDGGHYLPVLFEDLADPILSGREELGMPKLWSELGIQHENGSREWKMTASWLGEGFSHMQISELEVTEQSNADPTTQGEGLLWYKYIPKSGALRDGDKVREADSEYAMFLPYSEEAKVQRSVDRVWTGKGSIAFDALGATRLPTLHHIVERLAEIPIYEVIEAKVVEGRGVSDVRSARQLQ